MSLRRFALERGDVLCLAAILVLATLFLAPALRPGYTLLPLGLERGIAPWHKQVTQHAKNLLLSDPFYTFYPRRYFFTASLQRCASAYPLWNPHIFSGHPVMGDTAAQTFYPLNLVAALFLSAARALPILAWFHLTLTGFSMFAFLRFLRLRPGSALFGAVAWMLNGNTVVWLENPHRLSTLAWMPAVFLFYELALRRRRVWPGVVAGFLYGLSILGGHTQFALGIGVALAACALFRTIVLLWTERRLAWRPLAAAVMVGLLGVGIGAIQLLPTLQLAGMSHRSVMDGGEFWGSRWPLQQIIGLWIPDFYGNPVRFPYWGARNYAEMTVYYGAFAFPLSLVALARIRRTGGKFFILFHIIILLIVLGTPLVWLVAWLPGSRYFRLNSLIAYLPFFGGAAAAFGLETALDSERQEWVIWVALLSVLAGLAGITTLIALDRKAEVIARWAEISPHLWRAGLIWLGGAACLLLARWRPDTAIALLVILLAVDLCQWGMPFNPVNSLDILYPENEVTAWLRQDSSLYRVLPLQINRVVFGPNILSVFDFYETGGYSSLMVERYRQLVKAIDDEVTVQWMRPNRNILVNSNFDPLFSLLNVKYVLSTHSLDQFLVSVEAAHPGCVEPGLPLTAGVRITQAFQARNPGLNRVDVEFTSAGNPVAQPIRFLLWRDREEEELVADITIDGESLSGQSMQTFFFAPVADSAGQIFVWAIEAPEAVDEAAIAICQAEREPDKPAFTAYSTQLQQADIRQGVWIYENPNVLPRAFVVHRAEIAPDQALLERLTSADFNPWTTALLEEPLPAGEAAALADAPLRSPSAVCITRYEPCRVEVEAEMTSPGLLILSDTYYPGWKVTVDGQPASLLRVNYALQGVYLPAGEHQVMLRFVPTSFWIGLTLTAMVIVFGAGFLLRELVIMPGKTQPGGQVWRMEEVV
jgi:hypothetical protein